MAPVKPGDRVRFDGWGEPDPYSDLQPGTLGTVLSVDSLGTVHVRWDSGNFLGLVAATADARDRRIPDRFTVVERKGDR